MRGQKSRAILQRTSAENDDHDGGNGDRFPDDQ
jgi:hypothetical protein